MPVVVQAADTAGFSGGEACVEVWAPLGTAPLDQSCDENAARVDLVLAAGTYFALVSEQGNTETLDYSVEFNTGAP